jgi:hypothetical protein
MPVSKKGKSIPAAKTKVAGTKAGKKNLRQRKFPLGN